MICMCLVGWSVFVVYAHSLSFSFFYKTKQNKTQYKQDADVLSVMSIQSSRNQEALQQLQYYMVPTTWFRRAWPLLSGQVADSHEERERVGEIPCRDLLSFGTLNSSSNKSNNNNNDGSNNNNNNNNNSSSSSSPNKNIIQADDDDDNDDGDWQHVQWQEIQSSQQVQRDSFGSKKQQKLRRQEEFAKHHPSPNNRNNNKNDLSVSPLRHDLQHETDFYLLGPNAWLLIQSKFGNDFEIARSCTFVQQDAGTSLAVIIVVLDQQKQRQQQQQQVVVPIPPTGRFCYESVVALTNQGNSNSNSNNTKGHHPGNVSDDDTDDLVSKLNILYLDPKISAVRFIANVPCNLSFSLLFLSPTSRSFP